MHRGGKTTANAMYLKIKYIVYIIWKKIKNRKEEDQDSTLTKREDNEKRITCYIKNFTVKYAKMAKITLSLANTTTYELGNITKMHYDTTKKILES